MKHADSTAEYILEMVRLLRPVHWIKNLLVWLPIFFSRQLLQREMVFTALMAFVSFSLAASSVYILNDICDAGKDCRHPIKCRRPIASGLISIPVALSFLIATLTGAITINIAFSSDGNGIPISLLLLVIYLIMNFGYSIGLKNIPIIDIAILSMGFLIRVWYGGEFCSINTSPWLFITVFATSIFIGSGKRRGELRKMGNNDETRAVLKYYSMDFLNLNMYLSATCGIVFFSLWSISIQPGIMTTWTIPLVVFSFMRYYYVMETKQSHDDDPVLLFLADIPLLFLGIAIALLLFVQLYGTVLLEKLSI